MTNVKLFNPSERLQIASDTLANIGVTHDPTALHYHNLDNHVIASEVGSGLDVNVISWRHTPKTISGFDRTITHPRYLLNEQLRYETVRLDGTTKSNDSQLRYVSSVDIISSPSQFNLAQVALGRKPGVTAFRFEKISGKGDIPLHEWLGAIARKSAPVADPIARWSDAEHDVAPYGHALAWLHTNGRFIDTIATNTQKLIDFHGDAIALPKARRPQFINEFAGALEHLPGFIKPIFDTVAQVGESAENLDKDELAAKMSEAGAFFNSRTCRRAWKEKTQEENDPLESRFRNLKTLGIARRYQIDYEMAQITARSVIQITDTLLKADEVWPRADLSEAQQKSRRSALDRLQWHARLQLA